MHEDDTTPMFARPIEEQVSVLRHDVAGVRQSLTLLHTAFERITDRQNLMEAQMATVAATPETMRSVVEAVLNDRAEANRQERAQERAELRASLKRWAVAFVAVVSFAVPTLDKLGHWVGLW